MESMMDAVYEDFLAKVRQYGALNAGVLAGGSPAATMSLQGGGLLVDSRAPCPRCLRRCRSRKPSRGTSTLPPCLESATHCRQVSRSRRRPLHEVRQLAKGRVYTGKQVRARVRRCWNGRVAGPDLTREAAVHLMNHCET